MATHPMPAPEPDALFLASLPIINATIRQISFRKRLSDEDADEFRSRSLFKLIADDYDVLRVFAGRSSLRTYLHVVLLRVLEDYRVQKWGKWRPPQQAVRLGPTAVLLDRLIARDHMTADEAIEVATVNFQVRESRRQLRRIVEALPQRTPRQLVDEDVLSEIPDPGPDPRQRVLDSETARRAQRTKGSVARAVQSLGSEDRLILTLRFRDGLTLAAIARALQLDQRSLYRRMADLCKRLRTAVEVDGVSADDVRVLLADGWGGSDLLESA